MLRSAWEFDRTVALRACSREGPRPQAFIRAKFPAPLGPQRGE